MNFKKFLTIFAAIGLTGLFSGCSAENASQSVPQSPENNINQTLKSNQPVLKYAIPDDIRTKYGIPGNRAVEEYGIPMLNKDKVKYKKHPDEDIVDKYAIPEMFDDVVISDEDGNE